MKSRVRRLRSRKTIMIVEEVSMMVLSMISVIDYYYKIANSFDRSSLDFFGSLPIVICIGDSCQFPPVRGQALKELRKSMDEIHSQPSHTYTNLRTNSLLPNPARLSPPFGPTPSPDECEKYTFDSYSVSKYGKPKWVRNLLIITNLG